MRKPLSALEFSVFTENGRVSQQTHTDGGVFTYSYTLDGNGNVTATDLTYPNHAITHMAFNSKGYTTTENVAVGLPEEQDFTYTRDPISNFVLSYVDGLGREISYTYDSLRNITSITQPVDSTDWATTSFTYDPVFSQLTSITNPLGSPHTWTMGCLKRC
jgi:YD repeat-containing protein